MEYSIGKAAGLVTGIIVGLIICVILLKFMNRNRKMKTEYDERQKAARGMAYMYAFWSVMIATAIIMVLDSAGIVLASSFTKGAFIIYVGIIVHISYSIFNDAYYGINTNKKRFVIVCLIAGLCNLLAVIGSIKGGVLIQDGIISDAGTNLLCVIMLFTMAIELIIKERIDSKKAVETESED